MLWDPTDVFLEFLKHSQDIGLQFYLKKISVQVWILKKSFNMFLKEHLRVTISGPVQETKWGQKFHLNLNFNCSNVQPQ